MDRYRRDAEAVTDYLTRAEARDVDRRAIEEYGMSGLVLMENAGRGCVDVLCELGLAGEVIVFCGKGNNGGDGFVIARHLEIRGFPVQVILCCDPAALKGDGSSNFEIARRAGLTIRKWQDLDARWLTTQLDEAEWCVDALLGTGAVGAPRPPVREVVEFLNGWSAPVLAVDIPSGLDCETGLAPGVAVRATVTCTFVAPKIGFQEKTAAAFLGQVKVLDIGAPRALSVGE